MSHPFQTRRRPARGAAAFVAALLAAGAGLAALPHADAAPSPGVPAGHIKTMGGVTRNFQQGGYGPENVLAVESQFQNPRGLTFAPSGEVYITDALNHRVRKIDDGGVVSLVAGNGVPGHTGDGGDATLAQLHEPHGVAVDSLGNVYIADSKNCVIRKVNTAGIISRFAGTGNKNLNGACTKTPKTPDGPALGIALDQPKSLYMSRDPGGNDTLWIADMGNSQIRKIEVTKNGTPVADPQNVRVAGTTRARYYSDGGPSQSALEAEFRHPEAIWVADDGTIYVSDGGNNLIRRIDMPAPNSSIRKVSVIAGDVAAAEANAFGGKDLVGSSDGDGGPAASARLDKPRGITGDNQGHLYVAEEHGSRIRRINLNTGIIHTIAGDGTILEQRANGGSAFIPGENGPALDTQFAMLHDIQINRADGSLWIADSRNNRVRAVAEPANAGGASIPTGGTNPPPNPGGGGNLVPVPGKSGYWMLGVDGKVYAFGDARDAVFGDAVGRLPAGARAVHIEPTPSARGYWITDDRGSVHAFGDAAKLGGVPASALQRGERVTSLSRAPSGAGYWVFTTKGRVFTFGDAGRFGDLGHLQLNGEIRSSIPTPTGQGYYMVGSDGGVFAFGDAKFHGSTGDMKLNKPVLSLVPTRTGSGYWLVASDGGIFAFGDAGFRGSMGDQKLNQPVVGMVRYGNGYLMVAADGGIFSFSEKGFAGSLGDNPPAKPIVFAATLDS